MLTRVASLNLDASGERMCTTLEVYMKALIWVSEAVGAER